MEGEELNNFIAGILDAKQYADLDSDIKNQMASDLKKELLEQIDRAVINELPDDKLQAFNTLLDDSNVSPATLQEFITNSGVDVKSVAIRTMLAFRELYVENPQVEGAL